MSHLQPPATPLASALLKRLPPHTIITHPEQLAQYSGDKWFASALPEAVSLPENSSQVALSVQAAIEAGAPITPRGAGFGYVGGCVPSRGGLVISTEKMNRILEIHPSDFVAVVQPGVITGHLQQAVREKGLFYPPDPASLHQSSIGGNIATNAGGPRCLKYGVTRNYVLGLEVVLPDGRLMHCGSRTHKNKTGLDLVGLFVGSEGLLGIITQATLRLLPHPPARAVLCAGFPSITHASHAITAIFSAGFLPSALEIADQFTLASARSFLPHDPFPPGNAILIIELDGHPQPLLEETRTLQTLLTQNSAHGIRCATNEHDCEKLWNMRRAFSDSLKATGLKKLNEDIVVPRGKLVDLVHFAEKLQHRHNIPIACFGHAGDGNIHVNLMIPPEPQAETTAHSALNQLFQTILSWGGAITGEHGVGIAKIPWWNTALDPVARDVHQLIKNALDPHRIFNPGKFLD